MQVILNIILVVLSAALTQCTIDGLSYIDPLKLGPYQNELRPGEDPCNPLFWYPRNIPEYCLYATQRQKSESRPIPMPITIPLPSQPVPNPPMPLPFIPSPPMPLPFGIPIAPTNPMLPVTGISYQPSPFLYRSRQVGMVPGLPGLVSPDGGINILPFSDAYSDLLERHKQRMIRKRLQEVLDEYEEYPRRRRRHKRRRSTHYV